MKLSEKHKQFVVKRFARFMKVKEIAEEFVDEFEEDLDDPFETFGEFLSKHEKRVRLAAMFRRLNVKHSQFPEKYRDLFNEEREKFLADYRNTLLHIPDNVTRELEALYGLTRELAFEQRDAKYITLALQILKTIVACNAVNAQQEVVEITPEDAKQLSATAKTITDQVKKESQRLENLANQKTELKVAFVVLVGWVARDGESQRLSEILRFQIARFKKRSGKTAHYSHHHGCALKKCLTNPMAYVIFDCGFCENFIVFHSFSMYRESLIKSKKGVNSVYH